MFEKTTYKENQQPSSLAIIFGMEKVQRSSRKGVGSSDPKRRASVINTDDDMILSCMRVQAVVRRNIYLHNDTWLTPMYENNVIEQTNVASTGFSGAKSDTAHFFGKDTVAEAIVVPEEIRGKIPTDYGRSKGVSWYYLGGFGIVHTDALNTRIINWTCDSI